MPLKTFSINQEQLIVPSKTMCDARRAIVIICIFDLILILAFAGALGWKVHQFKGSKDLKEAKCQKLGGYYAVYAIAIVLSLIRCIIGFCMCGSGGGCCCATFYLVISICLIVLGVCFLIVFHDYTEKKSAHWIVDITFGAVLIVFNLMCSIVGSALLCRG